MKISVTGSIQSVNVSIALEHICDLDVHTSIVVGSGILVGAVLLALSAPFLRRGVCDEEGSSSQHRSSERKHVVMLHNGTI